MSIYAPATIGASDNQLQLNVYTNDPVYRVLARAPSKWQIRQQDLPVPFESGSNDFLTLLGENAYVINGVMYPGSEQTYDSGLMALRTLGSLDISEVDPFSNDGYVPYMWGNASGSQQQVFLKVLYCQLVETTKQGFVQPLTLYCKIIDPTIYGGTLKTATTQGYNPTGSTGSAVAPFVVPVVVGATIFQVSSVATNNGTLPSYPQSVNIYGPVTNPKITNMTTGEYIQIGVTVASGQVLNLTYNKTTLSVTNNGVNVLNNVAAGSTYFKIHPGDNNIQLTGTLGSGAYATVSYYDSWPLA